MITWLRYAFRNLLRNRRRSLYTVLAVGIGFAAINLFGGFTDYVFTNLRESFIYVQGNGHLAVFKEGAWNGDTIEDPLRHLLSQEDIRTVRKVAEADEEVIGISEVMSITGLLSNGDDTTIFVGTAWVPEEKYAFQGKARGTVSKLNFFEGKMLDSGLEYGIGIGKGLARKLGSRLNSNLILMSPTVYGQINAIDSQVSQLTDAPMELLEDKWVVMPLSLARTLYDTDGSSRINLLLKEGGDLIAARSTLEHKLRDAGLNVDVVIWRDLSPFYVKVEKMFRVIFFLIFVIVSTIIVMSVVNTVSMAVLERSREIGTLRAIGARRSRVVSLFSIEGALLGFFGCLFGVAILSVSLGCLDYGDPHWTPPQMARTVPLEIYLVPEYLILSAFFLTALSFGAGVLPARQIARRNVVEALAHV